MLKQATGQVEETIDAEFNEMNEFLNKIIVSTTKLFEDAKQMKEIASNMLINEEGLAEGFRDILEPIENDEKDRKDSKRNAAHQFAIDYLVQVKDLKDKLVSELEKVHLNVIEPLIEMSAILKTIQEKIKKRGHKLIDFDRHRNALKKLQEQKDRTPSDEKRMMKQEQELQVASADYSVINNLLKEELPKFFRLHEAMMMPILLSLKLFQLMQVELELKSLQKLGLKPSSNNVISEYNKKHAAIEDVLSQMSLLTIHSRRSSDLTASGEMTENTSTNVSRQPSQKKPVPPVPFKPVTAVALFKFVAQQDGDLSFDINDRIEVIKKTENPNDWWTGRIQGRVGSFPSNYVKVE